jgi:hypothetical protein
MTGRTTWTGVGVLLIVAGIAGNGLPRALAAGPARVGQAGPELAGGPWINSAPLSMAALRGRVVLVEFWTYG